jgi:ABC-type nickel/cobalt efflux system permease component RcnA
MLYENLKSNRARRATIFVAAIILLTASALAHPLGNFTINHFARIEAGPSRMKVHYVIDMAEIPAFQELQAIDRDQSGAASEEELNAYLDAQAARLAEGLILTFDGNRLPLGIAAKKITQPEGAGGLLTLRIELDLVAETESKAISRVRLENRNYGERIGWREMVVGSTSGVSVFDSTAYANGLSDELKSYPEDLLAAPLDERAVEFSFAAGIVPEGAKALLTRDGNKAQASRDRFAELIAVEEITAGVALVGLLIAAALGAVHAMSPGHGKTVVGAYLIGSRGTAKHALYLGLTVTVTHTLGVFALGFVTLFASNYFLPEKMFPVLSLVSGAIVLIMGLSMFKRRLSAALGMPARPRYHHGDAHQHHHHDHPHHHHHNDHDHSHDHSHHHHDYESLTHSHGGGEHTHLPPGADGAPITWRSILALGVSGGLLPCPSALVVLLSAISLNRVGYGLVLVIAFSLGLAATLTAVGLLFVYAGRLIKQPRTGWVMKLAPVASALVIAVIGLVICYEALIQFGLNPASPFASLIGKL